MDAARLLADNGPFADLLDGFRARESQRRMAARIEQAIEDKEILIAESGTGTGKTLAYLVPALQSGRRVIISTGTRHLQDQLYRHDLPLVRQALQIPATMAILKGRSNYLCVQRLDLATSGAPDQAAYPATELQTIVEWSQRTRTGDVSEVSGVPEQSRVWSDVTSTSDNCLGSKCEDYDRCHVVAARKDALDADVLVVNHHLFLADLVIREEGFGQLLPGVDVVVFDEAHQLPETAARFFGMTLSSRQLQELAQDSSDEYVRETAQLEGLPDVARELEQATQEVRLSMGRGEQRAPWSQMAGKRELQDKLTGLREALTALVDALVTQAEHSRGLDNCYQRALRLQGLLAQTTEQPPENHVHWFETWRQSFRINLTPLDVADIFSTHRRELPSRWVFTSATLSVNGNFTHFSHRLGLEEAETLQLDSPFDFRKNALFYVPEGMPEPSDPVYTERMLEHAEQVINAARGRSFLLFTSYRALNIARERLQASCDFPLLVQGSAPRNELLERFRELGNAVLLGTSSFWEGVDVQGEALSCVIIDKLPFESPGDPVLKARCAALEQQGINSFLEYMTPRAVIALRQGVGRLIRDRRDKGLLVIADRRLRTTRYGKLFLDSLPPMTLIERLSDARRLFSP